MLRRLFCTNTNPISLHCRYQSTFPVIKNEIDVSSAVYEENIRSMTTVVDEMKSTIEHIAKGTTVSLFIFNWWHRWRRRGC